MRRIAEIQLRQSEIRQAVNGGEELPEERAEELRTEAGALEEEYRALLREQETEREARESDVLFRQLQDRIECRNYLSAAVNDRAVDGAEAELNKELELDDRHVMPWAALVDRNEPREERADVAAAVPDAAVGTLQRPVIPRVFRRTDAAWLGVEMPSVSAGTVRYPVLTAGAAGSAKETDAAQDAQAISMTGSDVEPTRLTARYLFRVEDRARLAGFEDLLRRDLREVMGKLTDDQVVSGDGTGANIKGFLHGDFVDSTGVTNPTNVAKATAFDAAFADEIDGLYAYDSTGVKLLIGTDTVKFLNKTRTDSAAAADAGGITLYQQVMGNPNGGMRATSRVAAPASNIQKGYAFRPMELRAIAPVWEGIQTVRDPYGSAASGQIALTMFALIGYTQPRGKAQEVRFKLA